MPFTPLHMGPGLTFKACLQGYFSLMVFGWSQILIDLQPLYVMLTGEGELHGFSHTYLGATLIGPLAALTGKYLGEIGLAIIREKKYLPITWPSAFIGAFIGTYSHVAIDSIMHFDVKPMAPYLNDSPFYKIITTDQLHVVCVVLAVVGAAGFYAVQVLRAKQQ